MLVSSACTSSVLPPVQAIAFASSLHLGPSHSSLPDIFLPSSHSPSVQAIDFVSLPPRLHAHPSRGCNTNRLPPASLPFTTLQHNFYLLLHSKNSVLSFISSVRSLYVCPNSEFLRWATTNQCVHRSIMSHHTASPPRAASPTWGSGEQQSEPRTGPSSSPPPSETPAAHATSMSKCLYLCLRRKATHRYPHSQPA